MARATKTETTTKAATKAANDKTSKAPTKEKKEKSDEPKTKRAPTAYNLFVKSKMAQWKLDNPDKKHKEAMADIGAMWKDSDLNPNKGKEAVSKKKKAAKQTEETKEPSSSDTEA